MIGDAVALLGWLAIAAVLAAGLRAQYRAERHDADELARQRAARAAMGRAAGSPVMGQTADHEGDPR